MNITEVALRFIAGGSLVAIISLLAKAKHPLLAGLFLLFPMVTLVGLYFAGHAAGATDLKKIALFSMIGLPATLTFLGTFYALIGRTGLVPSLALSTAAWCVAAAVIAGVVKAFA
jgi:uncharacterized membrane protein (GlpM family)